MAARHFVICNSTGQIVHIGYSAAAAKMMVPPGGARVLDVQANREQHYVDLSDNSIQSKTALTVSVSATQIGDVPAGTVVNANGGQYFPVGGVVDFSALPSGDHRVVIDSPKHLIKIITFTKA
jgi:hypothetical protein